MFNIKYKIKRFFMSDLEKGLDDAKHGRISGPFKSYSSVDEMLEEGKKETAKDKKEHPIRHFYYYEIWLPVWRLWDQKISNIPSEIRWWFQRANRGWSDKDNWCMHYHNSRVMKEMLIDYKENGHTSILVPEIKGREATDEEWDQAEKDTKKLLDKMISAFTVAEKIGSGDLEQYTEFIWRDEQSNFRKKMEKGYDEVFQTKEEYDTMKEGFRLFYEHYFSLWD